MQYAQDERHLHLLRSLGLKSYLCVPLIVSGSTLGALTFATAESKRRYTEADLDTALELANRAAVSRGKIELKRERASLAEVVARAVETSGPLIDERGHQLVVNLPPQPVYVDADLTRLPQVFANLLNNAAKYTERRGRIELTALAQGNEVAVSVKDSGIGIPDDKLRSVFEMFSQGGTVAGRIGHRTLAVETPGRDARRNRRGAERRPREGQRIHRSPAGCRARDSRCRRRTGHSRSAAHFAPRACGG